MLWALLGILVGILGGIAIDLPFPLTWTRFTAVIVIGMLDSLFGALRAELTKDQYNSWIFLSGLVFNIMLALGITLLGDRLGLDLYLAATFVFTFRIFSNLGIIRRVVFSHWVGKKKEENPSSIETAD